MIKTKARGSQQVRHATVDCKNVVLDAGPGVLGKDKTAQIQIEELMFELRIVFENEIKLLLEPVRCAFGAGLRGVVLGGDRGSAGSVDRSWYTISR